MEASERIVVAHSSEALRSQATAILRAAGLEVVAVCDSQSARLLLLSSPRPALLVADVALSAPPFYQLCQLIREQDLGIRVLLVSSVHSEQAYKRAPTQLYGADDLVEEHRLEAELLERVRTCLSAA